MVRVSGELETGTRGTEELTTGVLQIEELKEKNAG
jgi:hypothetical protein